MTTMSDIHTLLQRAKMAPGAPAPSATAKTARERKREEARRRKTRKVRGMVTTEAVRTTRARVPEFLTPPVAPAHASHDDVQAEAFDIAAHALVDALLEDDDIRKSLTAPADAPAPDMKTTVLDALDEAGLIEHGTRRYTVEPAPKSSDFDNYDDYTAAHHAWATGYVEDAPAQKSRWHFLRS